MKPGDKVVCVSAKEVGIPIQEGRTYTILRTFVGNQVGHEACIPGMERTPGVTLEGIAGYFRADRFQMEAEAS